MKKYFLGLIALLFVTGAFAKVGYVGAGFDSIMVSAESDHAFSNDSTYNSAYTNSAPSRNSKSYGDSGTGISLNGGYIVDDNTRINIFYISAKISSEGKPFYKISTLGLSYDYMFGKKVHQGFFVGGGLANATVKISRNSSTSEIGVDPIPYTVNGKGSSTGLLLRAGYEHLFDNGIFFLGAINADTGSQNINAKITIDGVAVPGTIYLKTGVTNISVSLNYAF